MLKKYFKFLKFVFTRTIVGGIIAGIVPLVIFGPDGAIGLFVIGASIGFLLGLIDGYKSILIKKNDTANEGIDKNTKGASALFGIIIGIILGIIVAVLILVASGPPDDLGNHPWKIVLILGIIILFSFLGMLIGGSNMIAAITSKGGKRIINSDTMKKAGKGAEFGGITASAVYLIMMFADLLGIIEVHKDFKNLEAGIIGTLTGLCIGTIIGFLNSIIKACIKIKK